MKRSLNLSCMASLLVLAFISGCSDDKPTEPEDGNSGVVSLDESQSASMSFVRVNGLPADNDSLYAIVLPTTKASDSGYSLVMNTDSGYYLVAPLNPADPTGGGLVQILISDGGTVLSEPLELLLDSLPEAPGELEAIVSVMQQILTEHLRIAGYTRDNLDNMDSTNIPLHLIQLAEFYDIVDSPDNPNSLRAIADGVAPMLAEAGGDMELFNRVWALTDFRDAYEDLLGQLQTVDPISSDSGDVVTIKDAVDMIKSSGISCFSGPDFGINDCASLAAYMRTASVLAAASNSAGEKVRADIAGAGLFMMGLIPGGKAPSIVGGTILFGDAKLAECHINLYPSEFVDGVSYFDPDISEFNEDFTEPGKWTEFTVSARSKGWVMEKLVLETILKVLDLRKAVGRWHEPTPPALEEAVKSLDSAIAKTVEGKARKLILKELYGDADRLEICPNQWDNIDCVDPDYSDVTVSSGQLYVDERIPIYEPEAIGQATFRIETNGAFGAERTGVAHTVNTREIVVHVDPFQADADTLEWKEFHYWVENAVNTDVDIELMNGGTILIQDESTVTVETPDVPWNVPLELKVTSFSTTGLRANATDERSGSATIDYKGAGSAIVTPGSWCLQPGKSQDFTVTYTGSSIETVDWEVDPPGTGSIIGSGETITYQAPNQLVGNVTLSATVNDTSTGYAYVDVSSCRCNWSFEGLGSSGVISGSGEWGSATILGALVIDLESDTVQGFNPPFVSIICYGFSGEVMDYPIEAMGYVVSEDEDWSVADTTQLLPTLQVTAYVENDYIEGRAYGTLSRSVGFNAEETFYEYITFNLRFRAEFFNLERPQCVDD